MQRTLFLSGLAWVEERTHVSSHWKSGIKSRVTWAMFNTKPACVLMKDKTGKSRFLVITTIVDVIVQLTHD